MDYVCLTVHGQPGEAEPAFKARLVTFWTRVLRTKPDDYETIYAEAKDFEQYGDRVTRGYMIDTTGLAVITAELSAHGLDYEVDPDDLYTKAEATGSDWFQVPH